MSQFTQFTSTFNSGASTYRTEKLGSLLMKEATLEDLTFALSRYFVDSHVTTPTTVPPQIEYAKIVDTGLAQLNFFKFVAQNLYALTSYANHDFGKFTVLSPVGSFSRVTKEEFTENKDYYLHRSVLEQQLSDVQPLELVRAVRLVLQKLVFRFFRTYDLDETREVGKKVVKVCNPSDATFRRGDHTITTEDFRDFVETLLDACRVVNTYSPELKEFRDVFSQAARTAKQMREEYKQEQQQQHHQHRQQQNHGQSSKSHPRFKSADKRFTQQSHHTQVTAPTPASVPAPASV